MTAAGARAPPPPQSPGRFRPRSNPQAGSPGGLGVGRRGGHEFPDRHSWACAPRPEGLTLARAGEGRPARGLSFQTAAPTDSWLAPAGGGGPGHTDTHTGTHTHAHTPHAARANEPGPGAGGGVFPGSSTAAAIYLLGFSRGLEAAPAPGRPPPAPASLPPGRAHTHSHTHAHTHPLGPGRSRGGNKTSWHVLRLQARPRRPADVKLQLGWWSS